MNTRNLYQLFRCDRLIFVGLGCAILYWLVESALDTVTFEGTFADRLLPLGDANELWMRVIIAGLLVGFSTYVQVVTNKRVRAEEELREAHHALEVRVEERTAEIREQREFLRRVIDTDPNLVFVKNWDGIFTLANQAVADIYGTSIEKIVGKSDADFDPDEEEVKAFLQADREVMETLSIKYIPEERVTDARTGKVRWFQTIKVPLVSSGGDSAQILGVSTEITERKRAEEALRESEDRLRLAVESTELGTWDFDPNTGELRWDNRCKELFGLPPEAKVDYETFLARLHPEDRERTNEIVQRALNPTGSDKYEIEYRTVGLEDSVERWVYATGQAFFEGEGEERRACRFIGTVMDITERKRAEEALREIREDERSRMARDLHDGPLQDLTYALAESQLARILSEDPELDNRLEQVVSTLKRGTQGLREAVYDLRMQEERNRPLSESLEHLLEMHRQMNPGCNIRLNLEGEVPSSPPGERGVELLRVIQEALNNARKHSGCENVWVSLRMEGDELLAEVEDDGRGFDTNATQAGVGQRSMRERVAALGGRLEVESEPGNGTRVSVRVPLSVRDGKRGRRG
jgi:PAS domain S-box-containing protein